MPQRDGWQRWNHNGGASAHWLVWTEPGVRPRNLVGRRALRTRKNASGEAICYGMLSLNFARSTVNKRMPENCGYFKMVSDNMNKAVSSAHALALPSIR